EHLGSAERRLVVRIVALAVLPVALRPKPLAAAARRRGAKDPAAGMLLGGAEARLELRVAVQLVEEGEELLDGRLGLAAQLGEVPATLRPRGKCRRLRVFLHVGEFLRSTCKPPIGVLLRSPPPGRGPSGGCRQWRYPPGRDAHGAS